MSIRHCYCLAAAFVAHDRAFCYSDTERRLIWLIVKQLRALPPGRFITFEGGIA